MIQGIARRRRLVQGSANCRAGRGIQPKQLHPDLAYLVYHFDGRRSQPLSPLDFAKSRSGAVE
jgi:hypothetical protein